MAWERVCVPKEQGGLGVKDLKTLNQCLLLKFLHRLHHPGDSSSAKWVIDPVNLASLHVNIGGSHWDDLNALLPIYRAITTSNVGNGECISFSMDHWLPAGQLMHVFPALFSHYSNNTACVADVLAVPLRAHFVPRLSRAAAAELAALEEVLEGTELSATPDRRLCH